MRGLALQLLIGGLLGFLARFAFPETSSDAWHAHSLAESGYIDGIMHPSAEYYCVETLNSSMSENTADWLVARALYVDSPSEDWQGLDLGKIDFSPVDSCVGVPWEFDVTVKDDIAPPCNAESVGCASRLEYYWDDYSQQGVFERGRIYIKTDELESEHRHITSHEVGHLLDLEDGGPDAPDGPTPCEFDGTPSIMHSYGCPNIDFPSWLDRAVVEASIPDEPAPSPQVAKSAFIW